jgi:imidazole glycerol phosphate synthase subunit HisF
MLNVTEETESSISDDEFVVNPMDTDSTWDTFETSKSHSVIQMIVNIPLIVMGFVQQYKRSYNLSRYLSSAYASLRGTFTYICKRTVLP